jgi:molybdenum cofactor cytidylyltransferase
MSVAAVVLAAGLSRRMGPRNKLLMRDASGQPMVTRVVVSSLASRADPVIVVTGHEAGAISESLTGLPVHLVHAPNYAQGMSASLQAGIAALPNAAGGALICLGDMPLVSAALLNRLISAFEAATHPAIVVPLCDGVRGNPVLWGHAFFGAVATLSGDQGARTLLAAFAGNVVTVETGDDAVLRDFDTPEAFG